MKNFILNLILVTIFLISACQEQKFSTKSPVTQEEKTYPINFTCSPSNNNNIIKQQISGNSKTTVVAEGQICLTQGDVILKEGVNILFILDTSGSMARNDPSGFLGLGTCGRSQAISAIVSELQKQLPANNIDALKLSIITFNTIASVYTNFVNINQFSGINYKQVACQAIGNTNYEDAFNKANSLLSSVNGKKIIYFLSDGEPTEPFRDLNKDQQAGLNAANNLKSSHQNLTLNVIFLNKDFNAQEIQIFESYLKQIASDPSRVKVVDDAQQLAQSILEFEMPPMDAVEMNNIIATVEAAGHGSSKVQLEYLKPDPSQQGVYLFKTKPFSLFGESSKTIQNVFSLVVPTTSNKQVKLIANIDFIQR